VYPDRVQYFDPSRRAWIGEHAFGSADVSRAYMHGGDVPVITSEQGNVWWIQQGAGAVAPLARYKLEADEITALASNYVIWRYTPDGVVFRCAAGEDGNYACQQHGPDPLIIDPTAVQRAFTWNEHEWLMTKDKLKVFDPRTNTAIGVDPRLASLSQAQWVRKQRDQLYFYRPGELVIARKLENNASLSISTFAASQVAMDEQGGLWGRFGGEWQLWQRDSFSSPIGAPDKVFVIEGRDPLGLDDAGLIYKLENGTFMSSDIRMPRQQVLSETQALLTDHQGGWWALTSDRIIRYRPTACKTYFTPLWSLFSSLQPSREISDTLDLSLAPTSPTSVMTCLVQSAALPLPAGVTFDNLEQVAAAQVLADALKLYLNGIEISVEQEKPGSYQLTTRSAPYRSPYEVADEWSALSSMVVTLPNGQKGYRAVGSIDLVDGALVARRGNRKELLTDSAFFSTHLIPLPNLDVGWLKWDRTEQRFMVETETGKLSLTQEELLIGDRFIFEEVEAILATSSGTYQAANQHGIWTYDHKGLPLDDPDILYQPVRLSSPISAAHGLFVTSEGLLAPGESTLDRSMKSTEITTGDVLIREDLVSGEVTSYYRTASGTLPATAEEGFIWDANRKGIAISSGQTLIQTDAGILPVDRLSDFDLGFEGLAISGGKLVSEGNQVYLQMDDRWARRSISGWRSGVTNPLANRLLVQDIRWTWSLNDGQLEVDLARNPLAFRAIWDNGFGFNFDEILGATTHADRLYVATPAFMEIAKSATELGSLSGNRLPPVDLTALEQWRVSPGTMELWYRVGDEVRRWDEERGRFVSVAPERAPWEYRRLVTNDILRFTWQDGAMTKEMHITTLKGDVRWAPFSFHNGRFPFDVVLSLASQNGSFYVGTRAGLQIIPATGSMALSNVQMVDIQLASWSQPIAVDWVGVPLESGSLIMAKDEDNCAQILPDGSFRACSQSRHLGERLRVQTPFWQWIQKPDGSVVANYRDTNGHLMTPEIDLRGGAFPHDLIAFAAQCGGESYSVWENGWVSRYPGQGFEISSTTQTYGPFSVGINRLVCVERSIHLPSQTIEPGLYTMGSDKEIYAWKLSGTRLESVISSAIIDALIVRADYPAIYESASLRLLPYDAQQQLIFEQRSSDNHWHNIPWESGRVLIDNWQNVLYANDHIWAATPAGLVPFDINSQDKVEIDPDHVVIIRDPVSATQGCEVTEIVAEDDEVLLRCNADSEEVFLGSLDTNIDRGAFKRYDHGDPFASKVLVGFDETEFWQWKMVDHTQGKPGSLQVTWRADNSSESGELVKMSAGRFTFDSINSLAFFDQERYIDVGTSAGWFQVPDSNFHLRSWQRPDSSFGLDPSQFVSVGLGWNEGQTHLCLENRQRNAFRLAMGRDPEPVEACLEHLGAAGIWRYDRDQRGLLIRSTYTLRQAASRELIDGRFEDDQVLGLPVTARDEAGPYYLVPTPIGVIRRERDRTNSNLLTISFPEDGETTISVLYMLDPQTPAYLHQNTLFGLENPSNTMSLTLNYPDEIVVTQLDDGPGGLLRVGGRMGDEKIWFLIEQGMGGSGLVNSIYAYPEDISFYQDNRASWPELQALIMQFRTERVDFTTMPRQQTLSRSLPGGFHLVSPILFKDKLLLIGRKNLLEINLSRVLRDLLPAADR
jgi:hypothetical protein